MEVAEEVGEDFGVGWEIGAVILKLIFYVVVAEATVYTNPGIDRQWAMRRSDKRVSVTSGEGMKCCVLGSTDGASYSCRG